MKNNVNDIPLMTSEIVFDVLKGEIPERPMISLWRHYPEDDLKTQTLVEATLEDYNHIPSDLLKLSPHGRFPVVDFGCEIVSGTSVHGTDGSSKCSKCVIQSASDWSELEEVDPLDGELGKQISFVKNVHEQLEVVPKMMTVFSPTMVARKLSNNKFPDHLQQVEYEDEIIEKVKMISDIMIEFAKACIDAGSDGIFAAVQEADKSVINSEQMPIMLDLNEKFMNELNKYSQFTVLHLHGEDLAFKKATDLYKPTAVNWHDQTAGPLLEEAHDMFDGGLLGGLDPHKVLEGQIERSIKAAKKLRKDLPLILSPGCVLLQGTKTDLLEKLIINYKN